MTSQWEWEPIEYTTSYCWRRRIFEVISEDLDFDSWHRAARWTPKHGWIEIDAKPS